MAIQEQENRTNDAAARPRLAARLLSPIVAVRGLPAWVNANRWKAAVVGKVFLSIMVASAIVYRLANGPGTMSLEGISLEEALKKLDAADYGQAQEIAERLRTCPAFPVEELGGPMFVLGAATAYEAESKWDRRGSVRLYLAAARLLEDAGKRGLPPDRQGEGLLLLGKSLLEADKQAQSLPVLLQAHEANPSSQAEIRTLLARAYLEQQPANPQEALNWNEKYLSDKMLSPMQRDAGLLQQARILYQLGDTENCRRSLNSIGTTDYRSEAIAIQGRLLIYEGDRLIKDPALVASNENEAKAAAKYNEAVEMLRQAKGRDAVPTQATRTCSYLLGVAFRNLKDLRAAREQFGRTHKLYFGTAEGLAAGLFEAEVLRELGEGEEAVAAYRGTLRNAGSGKRFRNQWLSLDELRDRILNAYRYYVANEQFDLAIGLTRSLSPRFETDLATQLRAEAQHRWAESLIHQAKSLPQSKAAPLRAEARGHLRMAGRTYARLAQLHLAKRSYPDDLWHSAECFLKGHDFENALLTFEKYLDNERPSRSARALVGMGEALLALDRPKEALRDLLEYVEFHSKDPASYHARLLASSACQEIGQLDQAKQLLQENLYHEDLTPKSPEWRDSLFALGKLLYTEGCERESASREIGIESNDPDAVKAGFKELEKSVSAFQKAIHRLSEAIARYPDAPLVIEAQYMVADADRRSAKLPQKKVAAATNDTTRGEYVKQFKENLNAALEAYGELEKLLNQRKDETELTVMEEAILRNCYFSQGSILFDLEEYEEAIEKYSTATNEHQRSPEALEAFVQIANCYHRLNRPTEARGTVEQAKVVLKRIPPDAPFNETTRYSREEWEQVLQWLGGI